MLVMAKKKPEPEESVRRPNRTGTPLHIYIPPELRAAIDQCAENNRRKLTQEVVIALENHLKGQGLWPPKADPPKP